MQILQRTLLLIAILLMFTKGWQITCTEKEEKLLWQWEKVQTEFFLQGISRNGSLSLEEYEQYHMAMNKLEAGVTVRLEEYRKEKDREGNGYFYLTTWEELLEYLIYEDNIVFSKDSVIRLEIIRSGQKRRSSGIYFMKITKAGGI